MQMSSLLSEIQKMLGYYGTVTDGGERCYNRRQVEGLNGNF